MIKLAVHESVEAALQKAFPKPAAAAKRALAKYISVVEFMLFDALQRGQTPEQRKLGLYCSRRLNIDPPCRFNIDPGRVAAV